MKKNYFLGGIVSIFLISVLVIGCSKGSSSNNNGGGGYNNNPPPPGGTSGNAINLQSMSFSPSSLTVKVGTTITWTNKDSYTHTVTADDNSFNSGDMGTDATFTHTFSTAGTFNYHCKYHSMMTAKIVVQ